MFMIYVILFFSRVSVCFLSRAKVHECIDTNHEFYVRLTESDLSARRVKTIEEYMAKIKPVMSCFSLTEKLKILYCIHLADYRIRQIHFDWYDGEKACRIPWKIGCVKGKIYEDGMPHTIRDTIILSRELVNEYTTEQLTNTLIHENVHLYQKRYPQDTRKYLSQYNFSVYKKREPEDLVRSNPDIDDYIYQDKTTIYKAEYKTPNPSFIEDTKKQDQNAEHPFEKMALKIENMK